MRRISLAVALIGAVAAAGCGGGAKPSSSEGSKGTAGVNFTVTVNNQGPGTVVSVPAGISCPGTCTATFASGTAVALTGTATGSNYFNGFFGACSGSACTVSGGADQYVVAYFSASPEMHPNYNDPAVHSAAFNAKTLDCASCHGQYASDANFAQNVGQGIAIGCVNCHGAAGGNVEKCATCHYKSGFDHQARYNDFANGINPATSKLAVSNVSVAVTAGTNPGTFKSTVTFVMKKSGVPFTAAMSTLKQKTVYFVTYDAVAKKFPTPSYKATADVDPSGEIVGSNTESVNFSYATPTLKDATTGTWTAVKDNLPTDPSLAANSFVYGYFGDSLVDRLEGNLNPNGRHFALMDNVVSFAKVVNGTIDATSTATVSGCERCHGYPYSKHGYRQGRVAGLNDLIACKACHTDFRRGTDAAWYLGVNEPTLAPAGLPALPGTVPADAIRTKYAYTANLMNDTHNSHAMEFAYPQSMSNCTTCHEGKLDKILTDANFTGVVCKSCHSVYNTADPGGEKAPSFAGPVLGPKLSYHTFQWTALYDASHNLIAPAGTVKESDGSYMACNQCHADDIADDSPGVHTGVIDGKGPKMYGNPVPLFKDIHNGKLASVYAANGSKYSASVTSNVDSITVNKAAKTVTVQFSMTGLPPSATVVPTVVGSLYGYNTKDFVASGHGSTGSPSTRVLEFTPGSASNGPRLTVTGSGPWTAVADLSNATLFPIAWDGVFTATAQSTKLELGFLPAVTLADGTTVIAASGLAATIDLTKDGSGTAVANQYGKAIVDAGKCNSCHEALGTTFHSPSYGSAGVVGCRLCHWVGTGSSHLEMQSRSIDSFVHAIHSYQFMDSKSVVFSDAFAAFEYMEHTTSVYPNFTIQNCESCHNPGTYNVPSIRGSLPGISSASWAFTGKTTNIPAYVASPLAGIPAVVSGPADRACGSCHRSIVINQDKLADFTVAWPGLPGGAPATNVATWGLTSFNAHTGQYGFRTTKADGTSASATEWGTTIAGLKNAGLLP